MTDVNEIVTEIMDYCDELQNYSYYELLFYAETHKPEWAAVLRKKWPRACIAEFLRSARQECRKKGIPQPTLYESMNRVLDKEYK